jgi:hypothetical protein
VTLVAGIDEAGYGPRLGPLVVSAAAYRLEGESAGPGELWDSLDAVVARPGRRGTDKALVGDSKKIYSSATGLERLERSLLALLTAAGCPLADPEELAGEVLSEGCLTSLRSHPWYRSRGERLPLEACPRATADLAGRLGACCAQAGIELLAPRVRLLAEGEFNRRVELVDNKATVLVGLVIELLKELRGAAGEEALKLYVDRLGGRTDYSGILQGAFPGAFVWEEEKTAKRQSYRLEGLAGPTGIEFRTKADRDCFPVALASMCSKYLREVLMRRFNSFWREVDSQIPATSGYYADSGPFLEAVREHCGRMGIEDQDLIRSR